MDLRTSFLIKGYILIPEVLSPEEVKALRILLSKKFNEYDNKNVVKRILSPSESLEIKDIYSVPFREKVVNALKELFGDDYAMFPDLNVTINSFGYQQAYWHIDANSEVHNNYLYGKNYKFAKCGIYLQDNTYDWGGGIDLIPGGHLFGHTFPFSLFHSKVRHKLNHIYNNKIGKKYLSKTAKISAGDLLIFDSRLFHKSSEPHKLTDNGEPKSSYHYIFDFPEEKSKYVIYWDCCNSNSIADFLKNSLKRADEEVINVVNNELNYSDYLRKKFPEDYPEDYVNYAKTKKVNIVTLEKEDALEWSIKYEAAKKKFV
jgi:hypothetical protein